ncbi:MAG: carboxymuconolactone decarboxylase family protein [Candidatus Marinimicrobia bacterium]|nr:carboxymuconolactone decarboxylase family protein [Candidatus Neomarinimicrobiota bacterium]
MSVSEPSIDCYSMILKRWTLEQDPYRKRFLSLGYIAGATTQNRGSVLDEWLPRIKDVLEQDAIEETVLQTLLFAGYPKTIEALKKVRKYFPNPGSEKRVKDHRQSGLATSRIVYGKHHPRLIEIMDELHPDLTRWMLEDGYGRVLSRPGLSLQEREIAVLVSLMASGMVKQYQAHLRGTAYSGVKKADIIWFTSLFSCIIDNDLKDLFAQVTKQTLEVLN